MPSVIEPSFGIGRIMTGILEHSFSAREGTDGKRRVLSFPAAIAPVKCSLLPLDQRVDPAVRCLRWCSCPCCRVCCSLPVLFCVFLPLTSSSSCFLGLQHVATVGDVLTTLNISFLVDDSNNSIGRRYARTDEIGIPFAITVENTLGVSGTVTLRDRDSCGQVCVLE